MADDVDQVRSAIILAGDMLASRPADDWRGAVLLLLERLQAASDPDRYLQFVQALELDCRYFRAVEKWPRDDGRGLIGYR